MNKLIGFKNGVVMYVYDDIATTLDKMTGCTMQDVFAIPVSVKTETEEGPVEHNPFMQLDEVTALDCVRALRDAYLVRDVDPIVTNPFRWQAMSAEEQEAWGDYRQSLLDITAQVGAPYDVIWPTSPSDEVNIQ